MVNMNKYIALCILVITIFTSCQPSKKTHQARLYLQGIDTALYTIVDSLPEPLIKKGELLSITVYSDNPEATAPFNQLQNGGGAFKSAVATDAGGSSNSASASSGNGGYLVDGEGNLLFHTLGPVHAEGFTKAQLKQLLQEKLEVYLKHPYVEIRFLNKRITILGEVAKPGIINMPEEKISILDAIALSGDITNFGRKDNILVVREDKGKRTSARLNIRDPKVFQSNYFYLHPDDMVYIEPDRKKPAGTDQILMRNIALTATLVSTLAILYTLFKK